MLKPAFQEACRAACENLARDTADGGPAILVGLPWVEEGSAAQRHGAPERGPDRGGAVQGRSAELRRVRREAGVRPRPLPRADRLSRRPDRRPDLRGHLGSGPGRVHPRDGRRDSARPQRLALRARQAGNPPERRGVARGRERPAAHLSQSCRRAGRDSSSRAASFALNPDRSLAVQLPGFRQIVARTVWERGEKGWRCVDGPREIVEEGDEADYAACVLGLRDYVDNNRFPGVVLGLSGGVDSALCAAMAVDALGSRARPCRHAALPLHLERSRSRTPPPAPRRSASATTSCRSPSRSRAPSARWQQCSKARRRDITEENIQSRARGLILMAISNKFGADGRDDRQQVGNVGRLRHALRRHERRLQSDQGPLQNGGVPAVRACATAGSPSARSGRTAKSSRRTSSSSRRARNCARTRRTKIRCRPIRFSTTSCIGSSRRRCGSPTSSREGFDPDTVRRVERLLYLAEYKRRQSAPGVKVGPKNFGRDRRYPIVNRFRDPGLPAQRAGRRHRAQGAGWDERKVRGIGRGLMPAPRLGGRRMQAFRGIAAIQE